MKAALVAVLLLIAMPLVAQEETLLGTGSVEHGGYGALVVKFTSINKEFGVLVGARGGWIINHTFAIGIGGYGLANEVPARSISWIGSRYMDFGYGGLDLEYIANSNAVVHYSVHTLIGAGALGHRSFYYSDFGTGLGLDDVGEEHRPFFVLEPGVNVDLNVTTWFRFSVGASYRFIGPVRSDIATADDLKGPSGMLTFRFGSF
jgi:hypothetical protein